jgi:hypothetical protein
LPFGNRVTESCVNAAIAFPTTEVLVQNDSEVGLSRTLSRTISLQEDKVQNQAATPYQPVHNLKPYKRVEGTHQIEHFSRATAGLDVDKDDIKRYYVFIEKKIDDLLVAEHTAKAMSQLRLDQATAVIACPIA